MNRSERAQTAKETLEILTRGFYFNRKGEKVDIKQQQEYAVSHTIHYKPKMFKEVLQKRDDVFTRTKMTKKCNITVRNETSIGAIIRFWEQEGVKQILCLNFASAKNPGGGFLRGSGAQEESLARATGLYPCISQVKEYYNENKRCGSALYTHHMIYSPEVPVFKDEKDELLDSPLSTSVITAPAVNAGIVRRQEPQNIQKIEETMRSRVERVLSLAVIHNHKMLVLGAWGCGVFKNDPRKVANYFADYLIDTEGFSQFFTKVVFAVRDKSRNHQVLRPFQNAFENRGERVF